MLRYAITPGKVELTGAGSVLDQLLSRCSALAKDGVEYILVREKHLEPQALERVVRAVVESVRGSDTRVLVAGPVESALAAGADGVHVGSQLHRVASVRKQFASACVSCSCHSVDEVVAARTQGVDVILFAPIFGKVVGGVKVVAGVGLEQLQAACGTAGAVTIFALGGVTEANQAECMASGASGVAGIRRFFGSG